MMAIVSYNAIACGTPADSPKGASEKSKHWKKFIRNLDWNYLEAVAKAKSGKPQSVDMFKKVGFKVPEERRRKK